MAGYPAENDTQTDAKPRRIVVVGTETTAQQFRDVLASPDIDITTVPSYLAALGELSAQATDWLIGPADAWQGSPGSIVHSARTLSPGIRLAALCDRAAHPAGESARDAGFDAVINTPLQPDTARQLFGESPVLTAEHTSADQPEELGDIDLADALLNADGDVADVALRMIEANGGIHGVGLRPADGEAPQGHESVQVRYHGRSLGLLHAPAPATNEHLAPWAEWLGRWLALRAQFTELRDLALRDELTGVWNRRYFNRFLDRILKKAARDRSQVTLLVFDIDDFKLYNDKYGHGTGDEVLREAARLMLSVVREHDVVARIGGDEFAVIFWDNEKPRKPNSEHPNNVVAAARRFQEAICSHRFPKLMDKAIGRLTVSGGLASFPWDGRTPHELLSRADAMALQSKRQGKNAITFGTGNKRARE